MIQLTNVSQQLWAISTTYKGARGLPIQLRLKPKTSGKDSYLRILKRNLANYGTGVKQEIADAVSAGIIQVNELDGVHVAPDKSGAPEFVATPTSESGIVAQCISYKNYYNTHVTSATVHTTADTTNVITSPDPTDLSSSYTLINEARLDHNAHLALAAAHPLVDTFNLNTLLAVATPEAAVYALRTLINLLQSHKQFAADSGNPPLNPIAIINYT